MEEEKSIREELIDALRGAWAEHGDEAALLAIPALSALGGGKLMAKGFKHNYGPIYDKESMFYGPGEKAAAEGLRSLTVGGTGLVSGGLGLGAGVGYRDLHNASFNPEEYEETMKDRRQAKRERLMKERDKLTKELEGLE